MTASRMKYMERLAFILNEGHSVQEMAHHFKVRDGSLWLMIRDARKAGLVYVERRVGKTCFFKLGNLPDAQTKFGIDNGRMTNSRRLGPPPKLSNASIFAFAQSMESA